MAQSKIRRIGAGPNGEIPVVVHPHANHHNPCPDTHLWNRHSSLLYGTGTVLYGAGILTKFWVLVVV